MVVGRDYTPAQSRRPSTFKLLLSTRVVPLAVNKVVWFEVALDRASVRTGIRPAAILVGGMVLLSAALLRLMRRRR